MQRQLLISGVVFSLLAGCASVSQSAINPANWFGPSEAAPAQRQAVLPTLAPGNGYANFVDTRLLISNVSDISIARTSTGAIVTATGQAPSLGYFDAQLVPVSSQASTELVLEFRVRAPNASNAAVGTAQQREIVVARSLSNEELAAIGSITVRAANGARTIRR